MRHRVLVVGMLLSIIGAGAVGGVYVLRGVADRPEARTLASDTITDDDRVLARAVAARLGAILQERGCGAAPLSAIRAASTRAAAKGAVIAFNRHWPRPELQAHVVKYCEFTVDAIGKTFTPNVEPSRAIVPARVLLNSPGSHGPVLQADQAASEPIQ